jgi:hypothetical protein
VGDWFPPTPAAILRMPGFLKARCSLIAATAALVQPCGAQFSGVFIHADTTEVVYFDLTDVRGSVEGWFFAVQVDSASPGGLKRRRDEVRGEATGSDARLSSSFLFVRERIGSAHTTSDGFVLRVNADDGTLSEYPFRRTTSDDVNGTLKRLQARGRRARAAWEGIAQRRARLERYREDRVKLPDAVSELATARARLDSALRDEAAARESLAVAQDSAREAHARATAARQSAQTPNEQFHAGQVEFEAGRADAEMGRAEALVGSAKSAATSAREEFDSQRLAVVRLRSQLAADSAWLVAHRVPLPHS